MALPKLSPGWLGSLAHLLVGGSTGAVIVLMLLDKEPRLVVETFQRWGAPALIGLVAIVVVSQGFNRVMDQVVPAISANASASQKLADAVNEIAKKDSQEAYEQRVLLGHIGTTMEKVLNRLELIERKQHENTSS